MSPQEIPVNKKKKNRALQCLAKPHYPHFPGPKPNYFNDFLSSKMVDLNICPTCTYPTSNTAILLFHPPKHFFGEQNEKINARLKREHARALFFPTRQKHNVMK